MDSKNRGYFLILISVLLFSMKSIIVKIAYKYNADPVILFFMRVVISLPFFWITLYFREGYNNLAVNKNEIIPILYMGSIGFALPALSSFFALLYIDVSLCTVIIYIYPTIVTLLTFIFFKERITPNTILSIIITYAGLIVTVNIVSKDNIDINYLGVVFALISAVSFGSYSVLAQKVLRSISAIKLSTYTATIAAVTTLFFVNFDNYIFNPFVWVLAAILAILCGYLPILCFLGGLKIIGASKSAILSATGPVLAIVWAHLILGETLSFSQQCGIILVIAGVVSLKADLSILSSIKLFENK